MSARVDIDVWVDPCCPWAWLTWCWLTEVERVRDVRVRARPLSLAEVNADPERRKPTHDRAMPALRVMVAARRAGGDTALGRVYAAVTEAYQERGEALDALETLTAAVVAAGLEPSMVASALADPSTHEEILAEHGEAVAAGAFGVPTLQLDGVAPLFGPIVDRRLTAEAAGELWDCVVWLLRQPAVFEIKRTRTGRADVGRVRLAAAQAG